MCRRMFQQAGMWGLFQAIFIFFVGGQSEQVACTIHAILLYARGGNHFYVHAGPITVHGRRANCLYQRQEKAEPSHDDSDRLEAQLPVNPVF